MTFLETEQSATVREVINAIIKVFRGSAACLHSKDEMHFAAIILPDKNGSSSNELAAPCLT